MNKQLTWEDFIGSIETEEIIDMIYEMAKKDLEKDGYKPLNLPKDENRIYQDWISNETNKDEIDFELEVSAIIANAINNLKPYYCKDLIKDGADLNKLAIYDYQDDNPIEFFRDSMSDMYAQIVRLFKLFNYVPNTDKEIVKISDNDLWEAFFQNAYDDFNKLMQKQIKLLIPLVKKEE